uniref:Fibronectin type-III domain-containing protein n=1 Tax=Eucampia antarctica TaxID=49252 RepID=A0A7S2R1G5_9STRA|mmetsp:Transcript_1336/g.1271  ORF Transcript_1336/g.1271 Transcript_1336/m.1271 type:complete len:107 (+) Transcript_1336:123-443(+)
MTTPSQPKPTLVEATETVISVDFSPEASVQKYELKWKDYAAQSWDSKQVEFTTSDGKINVEVTNLNPGTTYCLKLVAEGKEEGPELIVDTETIGCTPKQKTCCTVQ